MKLIDSHAHLFLEDFAEDLPQVMERAKAAGVTHIFMPNIDSNTLPALLQVCKDYEGYCSPMIGLHPTSVGADYRDELRFVRQWLEQAADRFVAIGETGIDLYWDETFRREQETAFRLQVEWALEFRLPIVIHSRNAFKPVCEILSDYKSADLRGVFHSFTGTAEEAARLLEFPGFYIGINGIVTFRKSDLPAVLHVIPPERLVLETDAPYLAPVPHRGKRNESAFVKDTLVKVAEIYGQSPEIMAEQTADNALLLFGKTEERPHKVC